MALSPAGAHPDQPRLAELGFAPPPSDIAISTPTPGEKLHDRYRATLLAGAAGDALGRPAEGWDRDALRNRFPEGLRDFVPWLGHAGGPTGTITDDTQLTIVMAEWLCGPVPRADEVASRISAWGDVGRGIDAATRQSLARMYAGEPWWRSGSASAGNGAAMRAAPFGLRYAGRVHELRFMTALGSVPTHADISAVASAIVQAVAVNECLASSGPLDPVAFLDRLVVSIDDLNVPALAHRGTGERRSLLDRIEQVGDFLDATADAVFDHFFNGAFVLETTPVVLWCLLACGDDPEEALVTAVMGGRDADTVAAILGNLLGALHGTTALPERWIGPELEARDRLVELADRLYDLRWASGS